MDKKTREVKCWQCRGRVYCQSCDGDGVDSVGRECMDCAGTGICQSCDGYGSYDEEVKGVPK